MLNPSIIALDADGVLLDYHEGYARAWENAFGQRVYVVDPQAYWPRDRYGVPRLAAEQRRELQAAMDKDFWSSLQPLPGVHEACALLREAGHRLICVTALSAEHELARLQNFWRHDLPIERVMATGRESLSGASPKARALRELRPVAFVDDYLPYFEGVSRDSDTHYGLILREPNGSPNHGDGLRWVDAVYPDLLSFARRWTLGF